MAILERGRQAQVAVFSWCVCVVCVCGLRPLEYVCVGLFDPFPLARRMR